MREGDFSELLANRGANLNSIPQLRIPQGFPDAGQPAPNNNLRPYVTAMGKYLDEPLSAPEPQRSRQRIQLRGPPGWNRRTGSTSRDGWTGTSAIARRPTCGSRRREKRSRVRAACGGRRGCRSAADAEHRREPRPLVRGQHRHGAESDDDERSAGQLQPAHARQHLPGSEPADAGGRWDHVQRHLPSQFDQSRTCRPTSSTGGAEAARSGSCGRRPTTSTRTTTRCSSATS